MLRRVVFLSCLLVFILPRFSAADDAPFRCRWLGRPRVLYVCDTPRRQPFAEMLRANVPADVTFAAAHYGDLECHHLCDKPLEAAKADTAYVAREAAAYFESVTADLKKYDLVIAQFQPRDETFAGLQKRLVTYVRGGGRLIFINPSWETVFKGTPLADILPVKFERYRAWTSGTPGATDHPLVRGIPLETTGSHWYGPIYEPVDASCEPLTRAVRHGGKGRALSARFWYRARPGGGRVVHLYQAGGLRWQWAYGTNYATYEGERPDDSATWRQFYRRLIYGLVYGDRAFPVLARIAFDRPPVCRAGEVLPIPVDVENRSGAERAVTISVQISNRRAVQVIALHRALTLKKGERRTVTFETLVDLPCVDPHVRILARVLDGQTVLSEAVTWLAWTHVVPGTVATDRPAYAAGAPVKATIAWQAGALPGACTIDVYMADRTGRALQHAAAAATIVRDAAGSVLVELEMPDWGPEFTSGYWVTALVRAGGRVLGSARAQVQLDRPWDMRERLEWSVWSSARTTRMVSLLEDAGFCALGMQGCSYSADRFGLRQYVEGTGINTFGVTIEHDNWPAVRAAMEKQMDRLLKSGPDARSKSLVSLGEESGFKGGWGRRYYWEGPNAPTLVQRVFDQYLSDLYGGRIDVLNAEWGTDYRAFSEVPLERAKVRNPPRAFATAQAWEAMKKKGEGEGVIPVDVSKIDPAARYIARSAPFYESYHFFDWYYQKYCDLATDVYRQRRNPVPRTIMSAPGGFYPKVDVYNFGGVGPFYPKETALVRNAIARRDYGDVPGFSGAAWAYYDLRSLWTSVVYSSILAGNTHLDYWVDIPLTFNADLTHTRASFWTKALRARLRQIEPVLLHKRFRYTPGLGMYVPPQPLGKGITGRHFGSAISCNAPVYAALEESGLMPRVVRATDLGGVSVLVASHAQVVSAEDGRALWAFVEGGGLLLSTPWLASCSPHGNVLSVYPSQESELADLLGFRLLNTSQQPIKQPVTFAPHARLNVPAKLDLLPLLSKGRDKVLDLGPDVEVLAEYPDGQPLLLSRTVGRGRVIHLNMIYDWSHWWNSFHEPSREAFRRLILWLVSGYGRISPEYFIAFGSAEPSTASRGWWGMKMSSQPRPGEAVPWWASQLYTDPSGKVRYLAVFADHRSPRITASVKWPNPKLRVFDLLSGTPVPMEQGACRLTLEPGGAAFWAAAEALPDRVVLDVPQTVKAGDALRLSVSLPSLADATFGLTVDVYDPAGMRSRAHSLSAVAVSGGRATLSIPTALNDPAGVYRVVATESITRRRAEARFRLAPPAGVPGRQALTPFRPRPGETWDEPGMSNAEFLANLRRLRGIYEGEFAGLEAKYMLSYYLNVPFRPENRHTIVRRLQRTPWADRLGAVADAVRAGERFYLLGEDLNVDPVTGMRIDPFAAADPAAFVAAFSKLPGVSRRAVPFGDSQLTVYGLGQGALIVGPASVDRAAYHSSDFAKWHRALRAALRP